MEVHSHLSTRWAKLGSVLLLVIPLFVGIFFPTVTLDSTTVSAKGFHFPLAEGTSTAIQQDEGTTSQYLKPDTSTYFTKGAYEKEMRAAARNMSSNTFRSQLRTTWKSWRSSMIIPTSL